MPTLPAVLVERTDLVTQVTEALSSSGTVSITQGADVSGARLSAGGGIGKSVLASLVARSDPVRRMFPDGIVWVTLGETPDMFSVLCRALLALGDEGRPADVNLAKLRFRELVASKRSLVIVDDVRQLVHARYLAVPEGASRVLVTSRDPELIQQLDGESAKVDALNTGDAQELLFRSAGWLDADGNVQLPGGLPTGQTTEWADRLRRVPLPITILGSALRGQDAAQVRATFDRVEQALARLGDRPLAEVFSVIRATLGTLDEADRHRFGLLAVFAQAIEIPLDVTSWLWGTDTAETLVALEKLSGLLSLRAERDAVTGWSTHDHVREFLLRDIDDLETAHRTFLTNLEALNGDRSWTDLACGSSYLRDNLLSHMVAAGRVLDAAQLATDTRWVICRTTYDGMFAARTDIDRIAAELTTQHGERVAAACEAWSRLLRTCAEFLPSGATPVPTNCFADLVEQWEPSVVAAQVAAYAHNAGLGPNPALMGLRWWWHRDGKIPLTMPSSAQRAVLLGNSRDVWSVAFSPDGSQVASGGDFGVVRVWDAASGELLVEMIGHTSNAWSVAFSPDGSRVVSGSGYGSVRVWDAVTGEQIMALAGHTAKVGSVAFSPDGSRVVSGGHDHSIRVWDAVSGEQLVLLEGHTDRVYSVVYSPDGARLASTGEDMSVRVWDAASGEQLVELVGHRKHVWSVGFSPDGSQVVSGGDDGIRMWNASTGEQLGDGFERCRGAWSVGFSPDGSRLVSGGGSGLVQLWDAVSRELLAEWVGHREWVLSVAFSPDGTRVVSAGGDSALSQFGHGSVRVWDAQDRERRAPLVGHVHGVDSVRFSPDGSRLVSGGEDRSVLVWDAASGERLVEMVGHTTGAGSVAFSADGSRVVSGGHGSVRVWDAVSGDEVFEIPGHTGRIEWVGFSADGSQVMSGDSAGLVQVSDALTGGKVVELVGLTDRMSAMAISLDGSRVVTGDSDGDVRVWDAATGEQVGEMLGHTDWVPSVAFSPDTSQVLSGDGDGVVRVWDAESGKQLLEWVGHANGVDSVVFSADASRVITSGGDRSARVWDATSGELQAVACLHGVVSALDVVQPSAAAPADQLRLAVGCGQEISVIRICWRDSAEFARARAHGMPDLG